MNQAKHLISALCLLLSACAKSGREPTVILNECAQQPVLSCVDAAKIAIKNGANIHFTDDQGVTPLLAAARGVDQAIHEVQKEQGHKAVENIVQEQDAAVQLLKALIAAKVAPLETDKEGWTALHHAALSGRSRVVTFLLSTGLPVDVENNSKATPLVYAIQSNDLETVRILLSAGAKASFSVNAGSGIELRLPYYLEQTSNPAIRDLFKK